jgi:hypothetical protein
MWAATRSYDDSAAMVSGISLGLLVSRACHRSSDCGRVGPGSFEVEGNDRGPDSVAREPLRGKDLDEMFG